jgi:hypothetical protein
MSHFIRLRLSDAFASLSLIFWPLPQTQINGSNGIMSSIEGSKFEKTALLVKNLLKTFQSEN